TEWSLAERSSTEWSLREVCRHGVVPHGVVPSRVGRVPCRGASAVCPSHGRVPSTEGSLTKWPVTESSLAEGSSAGRSLREVCRHGVVAHGVVPSREWSLHGSSASADCPSHGRGPSTEWSLAKWSVTEWSLAERSSTEWSLREVCRHGVVPHGVVPS